MWELMTFFIAIAIAVGSIWIIIIIFFVALMWNARFSDLESQKNTQPTNNSVVTTPYN